MSTPYRTPTPRQPPPADMSSFLNRLKTEDKLEAAQSDRRVLENLLTELRKEIPRLDEDAWMYKKQADLKPFD